MKNIDPNGYYAEAFVWDPSPDRRSRLRKWWDEVFRNKSALIFGGEPTLKNAHLSWTAVHDGDWVSVTVPQSEEVVFVSRRAVLENGLVWEEVLHSIGATETAVARYPLENMQASSEPEDGSPA